MHASREPWGRLQDRLLWLLRVQLLVLLLLLWEAPAKPQLDAWQLLLLLECCRVCWLLLLLLLLLGKPPATLLQRTQHEPTGR